MKQREDYSIAYGKAKTSRTVAIRLHCMECCGFDVKDVNACIQKLCSLYPFRIPTASSDKMIRRTNNNDAT